jgi:ABC-type lipoprotein export system ATPase subunit
MNKNILQAVHLGKEFTQAQTHTTILHNINITCTQGKTYAIMGVSGSGKSTFMSLMAGLEVPTHGHVTFNDVRLDRFSPAEHARFLNRSIGLLFQNPYLLRELSVQENVMLPALIAELPRAEAQMRAWQLLEHVGLIEKKDALPGTLSGGQRQRIALARALCNRPAFLLADEPTGNLDEQTATAITALLLSCQREWHMGLIVSTHDSKVADAMQHIFTLHNGELVQRNL